MTQIFELCGIRWCFILFCSSLQYRSSKINPAFFVDKASCTRQFESELSLHSLASLFPIKKGFFLPLRLSCKESSTFSPSPSQWSLHPLRFPRSRGTETSGSGDVTALLGARNRYAIRLADHQRSSPGCAGWDRLEITCYHLDKWGVYHQYSVPTILQVVTPISFLKKVILYQYCRRLT